MAQFERRLNRAMQIIIYLLEGGHNVLDVCEEFRITKNTYLKDMNLFVSYAYGEELKRNQRLYLKAMLEVEKENAKRRTKRG